MSKQHETICIECKYQCSHKCSWAWEFVPVSGWIAIETKNGYDVYKCPNFVKGRGLPRSGFDTDGVLACLHALMKQTRDDYIMGFDIKPKEDTLGNDKNKRKRMTKRISYLGIQEATTSHVENRRRIEAWIRGDGQKLLMLSDHEKVIQQLRRLAKKYDSERLMIGV